MNITDRIALFIETKGISKNKFDTTIGTSSGYISKQILKSSSIGGDIIEKIILAFPEINPIWLLTGQGEMISEEKIPFDKRLQEIQDLNREDQQRIYDVLDVLIKDAKNRKSQK